MGVRVTLAKTIRAAMKNDSRNRAELARKSGVAPAVLSRFYHGERDLTLDTADKLCRVLGLRLCAQRKGR